VLLILLPFFLGFTPIQNAQQLSEIESGNYVLTSDIDMKDLTDWTPINFSGSLDGQCYKIKNLEGSLFAVLSEATVQSLHLEGTASTGLMAAKAINSTIVDSTATGIVSGKDIVGGFIDYAENSAFKACQVFVSVRGNSNVGGFVGMIGQEGLFVECQAHGDVSAEKIAGGFVGSAQGRSLSENANHGIKLIQCHSFGDVSAKKGITGGFAGSLRYSFIDAAGSKGNVKASGDDVGGFVGRHSHKSRITNACAYGNVSGGLTGGFVGTLSHGSAIERAFSAGDIFGSSYTGGFAGVITAEGTPNTLTACLSFSNKVISSSESKVRRLVGRLDHEGVNDCYAYLGSIVASTDNLRHVSPNAYGADGADFNDATIERILQRLGFDNRYWEFDITLKQPKLRIISTNR